MVFFLLFLFIAAPIVILLVYIIKSNNTEAAQSSQIYIENDQAITNWRQKRKDEYNVWIERMKNNYGPPQIRSCGGSQHEHTDRAGRRSSAKRTPRSSSSSQVRALRSISPTAEAAAGTASSSAAAKARASNFIFFILDSSRIYHFSLCYPHLAQCGSCPLRSPYPIGTM